MFWVSLLGIFVATNHRWARKALDFIVEMFLVVVKSQFVFFFFLRMWSISLLMDCLVIMELILYWWLLVGFGPWEFMHVFPRLLMRLHRGNKRRTGESALLQARSVVIRQPQLKENVSQSSPRWKRIELLFQVLLFPWDSEMSFKWYFDGMWELETDVVG